MVDFFYPFLKLILKFLGFEEPWWFLADVHVVRSRSRVTNSDLDPQTSDRRL